MEIGRISKRFLFRGIGFRGIGRPRRHWLIVVAAVTALVLPQVFQPAAQATDPATGPVQPWEAAANAAVVGVAPSTGGIYLTSTIGEARTAYDQTESQATSAAVDLGGLGYVLASTSLCGQSYSLSKQPQPLTADSTDGASDKTAQAQLYPGLTTPQGTGIEHVSVSPNPEQATASTSPVTQSVPGLLDVEGVAQSDVHYLQGQAQQADASVSEDVSLLGGKVTIAGLKWSASQQRGASAPGSTATFSYASININGLAPLPVSIPGTVPFDSAVKTVNDALATVGISITPPVQTVDPGTGGISMSPLHVRFSGSALDDDLANPTVGPLTQLTNLINGQVTYGGDCTNLKDLLGALTSGPETVLDLVVSSLSGSGGVDLYFGGASADTIAAPAFSNPFDDAGLFAQSPLPPTALSGAGVSTNPDLTTGPLANEPSVAAANPVTAPATVQPEQSVVSPAGVVKCITTNPTGGHGCWRGVGTWAGAAAVLLGGGLLTADIVYGRRRPRPRRRRRLVH